MYFIQEGDYHRSSSSLRYQANANHFGANAQVGNVNLAAKPVNGASTSEQLHQLTLDHVEVQIKERNIGPTDRRNAPSAWKQTKQLWEDERGNKTGCGSDGVPGALLAAAFSPA